VFVGDGNFTILKDAHHNGYTRSDKINVSTVRFNVRAIFDIRFVCKFVELHTSMIGLTSHYQYSLVGPGSSRIS
jgi:hypothetical protein